MNDKPRNEAHTRLAAKHFPYTSPCTENSPYTYTKSSDSDDSTRHTAHGIISAHSTLARTHVRTQLPISAPHFSCACVCVCICSVLFRYNVYMWCLCAGRFYAMRACATRHPNAASAKRKQSVFNGTRSDTVTRTQKLGQHHDDGCCVSI